MALQWTELSAARVGKVAIWLETRPDGPRGPILCTVDEAHTLIDGLHKAIDDRDRMRGEIDEIRTLTPDDFRG